MSGDHPLRARLLDAQEREALQRTLNVLRALVEAAPICLDVEEVALQAGLLSDPQVLDVGELRGTGRRLAYLVERGAVMEVVRVEGEIPGPDTERRIWRAVRKEEAELPPGLTRGKESPAVFVAARVGMPVTELRTRLNEHRQKRNRSSTEKGLSLVRVWTITERGCEILALEDNDA